ncbi:hypothetical protein [Thiospirillum jenense]|uniref:Uncharacterized protein n=1 Tax=Thiospirillum jenense TaxID=1653858 RepID=A0A839HD29_9GAMM|nr:hypothetical protein [Thiospirillum jenense]MBB1125097.1 hypothetical protein [Thiospirillum jenense]
MKQTQLVAHYTDTASIMRLIESMGLAPLRAEWQIKQAEIANLLNKAPAVKSLFSTD